MTQESAVIPDYCELLLGCGRDRRKRYSALPQHPRGWRGTSGPVTLDIDRRMGADLWCDLNVHPPWHAISSSDPQEILTQLLSDFWDEIHAYQVLEHLGQQGDAAAFFVQFSELWRLLKPGGYLVAEVPSRRSEGLWGDPSHRRAIVPMTLSFLDQAEYIRQCDGAERTRTSMSDFRHLYKADFRLIQQADTGENFAFVLQAVKPSRWRARDE